MPLSWYDSWLGVQSWTLNVPIFSEGRVVRATIAAAEAGAKAAIQPGGSVVQFNIRGNSRLEIHFVERWWQPVLSRLPDAHNGCRRRATWYALHRGNNCTRRTKVESLLIAALRSFGGRLETWIVERVKQSWPSMSFRESWCQNAFYYEACTVGDLFYSIFRLCD
jgi:hypothetical protein